MAKIFRSKYLKRMNQYKYGNRVTVALTMKSSKNFNSKKMNKPHSPIAGLKLLHTT